MAEVDHWATLCSASFWASVSLVQDCSCGSDGRGRAHGTSRSRRRARCHLLHDRSHFLLIIGITLPFSVL